MRFTLDGKTYHCGPFGIEVRIVREPSVMREGWTHWRTVKPGGATYKRVRAKYDELRHINTKKAN